MTRTLDSVRQDSSPQARVDAWLARFEAAPRRVRHRHVRQAECADVPGMDDFAGDQHHSSQHPGPDDYAGKKAVVVGSNNSAHDICAALWEHGADVTMVQRSSTHIVKSESVIDRVRDLIISGGENTYPSEVETAIGALPGVVDCALVGVPDERWGEVGAAFVVPSAPGAWTAESLRAALSGTIAGFKIPQYVHFVDDLPRTATGKVRKRELRGPASP